MTKTYNLRNIRKLVNLAYNLEELRQLCQEVAEFRPVYDNFGEERKDVLIRHLLEHSERKGYLDKLLAVIAENVPEIFAQFEGQLLAQPAPSTRSPTELTDLRAMEAEHLKRLIAEKMRHVYGLKEKEARQGLDAAVSLKINIEDLEKEITALQEKLESLL